MPFRKTENSAKPLVIIPCGGAKRDYPCLAALMYVGGYHLKCQAYAEELTTLDRILILSAKYGLLALDDPIEPYELRMGKPGCVSWSVVHHQAVERGLAGELGSNVIALGGSAYTGVCKRVWPGCRTPLDGVGGIGKQLAWMKARIAEHER